MRSARFELDAVVTSSPRPLHASFAVADETGPARISGGALRPGMYLLRGDRVRMSGRIVRNDDFAYYYPQIDAISVVSHGESPAPAEVAVSDLATGGFINHVVRFKGRVLEAFRDDTDIRFVFFVVTGDDGAVAYVPTSDFPPGDESFRDMVDARIAVTALCIRDFNGNTKRKLDVNFDDTPREGFSVLVPAPADPFGVPELSGTLSGVRKTGESAERRRTHGVVLAAWNCSNLLVRRDSGEVTRVALADDETPPACGDEIDVVGIPETDLYHLNLSRARWRPAGARHPLEEGDAKTDAKSLLTDGRGNRQIDISFHGRAVRLRGTVIGSTLEGDRDCTLHMDTVGGIVPVDFSSAPEVRGLVRPGCVVDVTGVFVVNMQNWRPQSPFPTAESCLVVVRGPSDVVVVSTPSWWTPSRSLTVVLSLVAALVVFFVWNRALTRIARRRWEALAREKAAREKTALRIEERTRLAVELHDTIAQNLTGAAMEVEAAQRLSGNEAEMLKHIGSAAETLRLSRDELRDCLWDLRSHVLDEKDMQSAILRTLKPHVEGIGLFVRFAVATSRLPENVTHAVLRVVRELALNGIRHGHATRIGVAGCMEDGHLLFSVADNGVGFDLNNHPDVPQGHYGIQGVRERLRQLGGKIEYESEPGIGTRVKVDVPIADE